MLAEIPFGLHEIDNARPVRPDWVVTKPILSGVCGSDAKLVLGDFNTGDIDNPMAAFSSLPHVPGHEVVAVVTELGPEARGVDVGQRVVLNPWLTCNPRGIAPPCPPCQAGDLSLCWSFTKGDLGPGVHIGVITNAPGAWAEGLAAHDSMLIPVRMRCPMKLPFWLTHSRSPFTPLCGTRRLRREGCSSTGPVPSD